MYPYNIFQSKNENQEIELSSYNSTNKNAEYNISSNNSYINPLNSQVESQMQKPDSTPSQTPNSPTANKYLLDMIKEAIKDEQTDADYYGNLSEKVTEKDDKETLNKIKMDEIKHNKMFNDIYYQLTGERVETTPESVVIGDNLCEEFESSMFNELEAVEFYRKLLFAFLNLEIRDTLFEIITDEQAHAQKLNYLYCKYK